MDSHYLWLLIGVIYLAVGALSTSTGVVWTRFGRVFYRAERPREFWEDVVLCYLIGICRIGYFLYQVYGR